jgi:hypothetical protein
MEFRKVGTDHVKLVLTNLHLINAGGLVAIPALAAFAEISIKPVAERLLIFGPSAVCFVLGLILAMLAALMSYYNSLRMADHLDAKGEEHVADLAQRLPFASDDFKNKALLSTIQHRADILETARRATRNYKWAHVLGWASLVLFVLGCILLILRVKEIWDPLVSLFESPFG